MREYVTVNKAIRRGHLIVNVPVFVTIVGCPIIAFYLSKQNIIPNWGIAIAFIICFVFAWLIWSYMITKWRIWAFESVRNVHELKKRAIQEKLIWDDGSIFEKTEIRSRNDKIKIRKLEKKFEKEDVFREDYSLPPKIEIYYSKVKSYFESGVSILIIGVGVYFLIKGDVKGLILGGIMLVIGLYSMVKEFRKLFNNIPQIIISNKGMQTKNVEFKGWSSINEEEVINEGYGKSSKSYLIYFYDKNEFEKIEIDTLNVTYRELENMIRTYRIRYNKGL